MGNAAVFDQGGDHFLNDRRGDDEADAGVRAGARFDRRGHAEQSALGVDQYAARVAWVDRGIGLDDVGDGVGRSRRDESLVIGDRQAAIQGADNARGHRAFEAERIADRHNDLANLGLVGIQRRPPEPARRPGHRL